MNPILKQYIIERLRKKHLAEKDRNKASEERIRKRARELEIEISHEFTDFIYGMIGILSAAFGLKGFLIPNKFIDGGVMGISLIVSTAGDLSLPILIFLFNLPFLILAYYAIGKRFAIKSILGILLLSLLVYLLPVPMITDDKVLVSTFGGFFLGLGIGMAIRGGAIIDGTEVLAIYLSRKSSLTVGNIILIFNLFIFLSAAYILSIEIALYAILTYFAASKTIDFVIDGIEEYTGVSIITDNWEEMRRTIVEKMGRGCTLISGKRGYAPEGYPLKNTMIVYTVISRLELSRLKTEIDKVDKKAFVVMTTVKDTVGGLVRRKPIEKIK
ncbi:YitT family protein [Robertkochia aurantiaca]|uniref:YitT family protein n=1 Tax=Robertkochia aurantiaca TaxID=2873700 RepID=UPI001CD039F9|nr:YitT family protein [Robertkochia sp. 3YJGBD-33]